MNDEFGDRMKRYEDVWRAKLIRRIPVILRLDGKAFHTLTDKFCKSPFDVEFLNAMVNSAIKTVREIQGAKCVYVQSDEVSILLTDFDTLQTDAWFDHNVQKMVSVSASYMSVHFSRTIGMPAVFDARVFNLPKEEVANYFVWRQKDWVRNSVSLLTGIHYSHKEMQNKSNADKHEMLHQKGVNWADMEDEWKNGVFISKEPEDWVRWKTCPNFVIQRGTIEKYVFLSE
jgi:tRNA(His) 5'-end guanylyltransferase